MDATTEGTARTPASGWQPQSGNKTYNLVDELDLVIPVETRRKAMHGAGVVDLVMRIPGDIVDALRLPPDEVEDTLHKELALALYQRGVLSSGKASVLAGMGRWEFEELLGQRQIRRHYTEENLEEDIEYARSHQ